MKQLLILTFLLIAMRVYATPVVTSDRHSYPSSNANWNIPYEAVIVRRFKLKVPNKVRDYRPGKPSKYVLLRSPRRFRKTNNRALSNKQHPETK